MNNGLGFNVKYWLDDAIRIMAKNSPYQLTNPGDISFFIKFEERYYPVERIIFRSCNHPIFKVNTGVYCLNPSQSNSPLTGEQLLESFEKAVESQKTNFQYGGYCRELDCYLMSGHVDDVEEKYLANGKVVVCGHRITPKFKVGDFVKYRVCSLPEEFVGEITFVYIDTDYRCHVRYHVKGSWSPVDEDNIICCTTPYLR